MRSPDLLIAFSPVKRTCANSTPESESSEHEVSCVSWVYGGAMTGLERFIGQFRARILAIVDDLG